jgi:endonuclease/exonuclease/phosphatase family metal-dependent hydrolase
MGAYSRSPGVGYRQATPSIEVRFSAPPVHGRRLIPLVLAFVLFAEPAAAAKPKLTVMTRNVYLGGNIAGPIPAPDRAAFERSASALWASVRTTDFPARAKLLAREVKQLKPDVIGLQEVALWRRGAKDGAATPATTVVYDFLKSLKGRLGPGYKVASVQQEADLEAPIADGYDVRLTMRDVVIVRKRVKVRRKLGANYKAVLEVPTAIGPIASTRGWVGADLTLAGKRFRFLNTHLEAFSDDHRLQQAGELLRPRGPLRGQKRVIVTGDINSDPTGATGANPAAYRRFIDAGLKDTWLSLKPLRPGFSCCFKTETIMDAPPPPFDHRVDHIFAKGNIRVLAGWVVGGDRANRTPSGLWPSDHGGAVVSLRLR